MEIEKALQLKITVISGEDLIARDSGNVSDPYVKICQDTNVLLKTTHKNKTLHPVWNEGFTVQVKDTENPLLFQVFDKDKISLDDFMGQACLDLTDFELDQAFDVCLELEAKNDEYLIKKTKKSDKSLGNIKINIKLSLTDNNMQEETEKEDKSFLDIFKRQFSKEETLKEHSGIVHVVLVQGKSLEMIQSRAEFSPYCKLSLSNQKFTSKIIKGSVKPKWREAFNFYWNEEVDNSLHIGTCLEDKRIHKNDEFLGSMNIDVQDFSPEVSHNIWRPLLGEKGTHVGDINIIITVTCYSKPDSPSKLVNWNPEPDREAQLEDQYNIPNSLADINDVGHLTVKVLKADGLAPSDYNGLADPFVVLELKNARVRTLAISKTLNPEWNQVFNFDIKNINEMLEVTVFDENDNTKEDFVGKMMIPLLKMEDGERRWFKLKDKRLHSQANGRNPRILLEINIHWNPIRAAYSTIIPAETKYMDKDETKFQFSDLSYNCQRVKNEILKIVSWINYLTGRDLDSNLKKIQSILDWESKVKSLFACFAFVFAIWIFEIWMIPFTLLVPFILRFMGLRRTEAMKKEVQEIDKQEEEKECMCEDEKSTFTRMKEIGLIVQTNVGFLANFIESLGNIFNFSVPFLSKLAFLALVLLTIVLYLLPFRTCLICWGLHKLTLRLFLPKHKLFNQSLLNFITAVPNDQTIKWCTEIK